MVYSLFPPSLNFRDSVLSNTFWSSTDAYNATVRANVHDLHPPPNYRVNEGVDGSHFFESLPYRRVWDFNAWLFSLNNGNNELLINNRRTMIPLMEVL
jgi:hypothetical protein